MCSDLRLSAQKLRSNQLDNSSSFRLLFDKFIHDTVTKNRTLKIVKFDTRQIWQKQKGVEFLKLQKGLDDDPDFSIYYYFM